MSISATQASITSPRLCGGMLVAMPTAMPPAPLTSRFGNFAGRTVGSRSRAVVVGLEIDGVLVDVVEQRMRDLGQARFGVTHRGRPYRRRPSRNCPARRSAARAWRNPAPCGPSRRRPTGRRADDIYRSRRRRCAPTCDTACSIRSRSRTSRRECGDAPASGRRAHPAARAPRSRSWRNRGRSVSSRRGWIRDEYRRAPAALRASYLQGQTKGKSGQFLLENHIAYRVRPNHP